jgi:hypothetical protein
LLLAPAGLDGVEVWRVRRQEDEPGADGLDETADLILNLSSCLLPRTGGGEAEGHVGVGDRHGCLMQAMWACAVGTLLTTTPPEHHAHLYVAGDVGLAFGQKLKPGSKQRFKAVGSPTVHAPARGRSLAVSHATSTLPVVVPTALAR